MPYVNVYVDTCDVIEEMDDDDLISALKNRGYVVMKNGTTASSLDGVERVEHLSLCGLKVAAQSEALRIVGDAIGRNLQ